MCLFMFLDKENVKYYCQNEMMRLFFWVCVLTMLPGLLIRIPFGGGGILLADILLPLFAISWLGIRVFYDRGFPRVSWWWPSISFIMIALLSWIWGAWGLDLKAKILSFSYIIRFVSILILGWAAYEQVVGGKCQGVSSNRILDRLFSIVGIIIFIALIQFFFIPDISNFSTVGGFDPHIGRLLGTWMDPNFVAGLLAFFLPVMCGRLYEQMRSEKLEMRSLGLCLLIGLCLIALFLTFSRSGYLAAVGGLGLFFLLRDPKIILIALLVVMIGLGSNQRAQKRVGELASTVSSLVLGQTAEVDATAKLRLQSWGKSLILWEKYPVLGIGYNTYRYRAAEEGIVDESYFSAGGSDSTLLTVLVTTGTIGFLVFIWFYVHFWFTNWWRYWTERRALNLGFVAGWSAILVHSVFVNSMLFPLIFMPMMIVAAVLEGREK